MRWPFICAPCLRTVISSVHPVLDCLNLRCARLWYVFVNAIAFTARANMHNSKKCTRSIQLAKIVSASILITSSRCSVIRFQLYHRGLYKHASFAVHLDLSLRRFSRQHKRCGSVILLRYAAEHFTHATAFNGALYCAVCPNHDEFSATRTDAVLAVKKSGLQPVHARIRSCSQSNAGAKTPAAALSSIVFHDAILEPRLSPIGSLCTYIVKTFYRTTLIGRTIQCTGKKPFALLNSRLLMQKPVNKCCTRETGKYIEQHCTNSFNLPVAVQCQQSSFVICMHWFLLVLSWLGVYQFSQPSLKLYAAKDKYMQLQNLMKGNISFAPEYSIKRYYHAQMLLLVAAFY